MDVNSIKKLNSNQIFSTYIEELTGIHKSFEYLKLADAAFYNLVIGEIDKSKVEYKGEIPYETYLFSKVKECLEQIFKGLLINPSSQFEVLNDFINYNYGKVRSYRDSFTAFATLNVSMKKIGFEINPDLMVELLKNNKIIKNMVNYIFQKYSKAIMTGNTKVFNNDTLLLAIDVYCDLNNIDIVSPLELEDSSDVSDELSIYLSEISNIPLLSRNEEIELGKKIALGDKSARKKLIESNLKLVVKIASSFKQTIMLTTLSVSDLIQEGNIGLMKAADRFDYTKGAKFSTYATWWIKQSIMRAITDKARNIRLPVPTMEKLNKYKRDYVDLSQSLGRTPTKEELIKYTGLSASTIERFDEIKDDTISLDERINNSLESNESSELKDFVIDYEFNVEDDYSKKEIVEEIHKLIKSLELNDRELKVLYGRYGFIGGRIRTLEEIGKELGISRERVRQIENSIIKKIHLKKIALEDLSIFLYNPDRAMDKVRTLGKVDGKSFRGKKHKSINSRIEEINKDPKIMKVDTIYDYYKYSNLQIENHELIDYILNQVISAGGIIQKNTVPTNFKVTYAKPNYYDCEELFRLIEDQSILNTFDGLKVIEMMMLLLKYGYVNGNSFTTATISSFFGIDYNLTTKMIKEALLKSKLNLKQVDQVTRKRIKKEEE